jgi:hypothetical protein
MRGAILDKGLKHFTDMKMIMMPFSQYFKKYNWLITECECYPNDILEEKDKFIWITGEELYEKLSLQDIQFVWAVFSGFENNISFKKILEYDFPYADGNKTFWDEEIKIQHPLAEVEIVPFDSTFVLFISKNNSFVETFIKKFPLAKDLEEYNKK